MGKISATLGVEFMEGFWEVAYVLDLMSMSFLLRYETLAH